MPNEQAEVKWFLVNSEQIQVLFNVLCEIPAKYSFDCVAMLRALQEVKVTKTEAPVAPVAELVED
jgi:hypothetical protein